MRTFQDVLSQRQRLRSYLITSFSSEICLAFVKIEINISNIIKIKVNIILKQRNRARRAIKKCQIKIKININFILKYNDNTFDSSNFLQPK